jgi:hypothetical protein
MVGVFFVLFGGVFVFFGAKKVGAIFVFFGGIFVIFWGDFWF